MHNIFTKFTINRLMVEAKPFIKEVLLVFIVFVIAYASYSYTNRQTQNLMLEKRRAVTTLRTINQNIKSANSAIASWENVKNTLDNRQGLDIEAFKVLVEQIKMRHAINNFTITLTTPKLGKTHKDTSFIDLEFNVIQINFSALTDVDAYRFLSEIMESVPGILHIEKFDFKVTKDLSKRNVEGLRSGKIKDTIKVSLAFKWHNIIDIK